MYPLTISLIYVSKHIYNTKASLWFISWLLMSLNATEIVTDYFLFLLKNRSLGIDGITAFSPIGRSMISTSSILEVI